VLQVRIAAVRGVPHVRAPHAAGGALAHFGQPRHCVPVPEAPPEASGRGFGPTGNAQHPPSAGFLPGRQGTGGSQCEGLKRAARRSTGRRKKRGTRTRSAARRGEKEARRGPGFKPFPLAGSTDPLCLLVVTLASSCLAVLARHRELVAFTLNSLCFSPSLRLPARESRAVLPAPVVLSETHRDGVRFHGQRVSSDLQAKGLGIDRFGLTDTYPFGEEHLAGRGGGGVGQRRSPASSRQTFW